MAVIKVFDSIGIKTVQLMGNLNEQDYDPFDLEEDIAEAQAEDEE